MAKASPWTDWCALAPGGEPDPATMPRLASRRHPPARRPPEAIASTRITTVASTWPPASSSWARTSAGAWRSAGSQRSPSRRPLAGVLSRHQPLLRRPRRDAGRPGATLRQQCPRPAQRWWPGLGRRSRSRLRSPLPDCRRAAGPTPRAPITFGHGASPTGATVTIPGPAAGTPTINGNLSLPAAASWSTTLAPAAPSSQITPTGGTGNNVSLTTSFAPTLPRSSGSMAAAGRRALLPVDRTSP